MPDIKLTNHKCLYYLRVIMIFEKLPLYNIGHQQKFSFTLKGNLAPESAVLKLSGKDIAGPFCGPVSSHSF